MTYVIVFLAGAIVGHVTLLALIDHEFRRKVAAGVGVVVFATVMMVGDAAAHPIPPGTPQLAGPLTPDAVQDRMDHIRIVYELEARRDVIIEINGPYRSPLRSSRNRLPLAVRPVAPTVEQWRPLVTHYFPSGWVEWALRIMQCESGGDPEAANPHSSARGLFQHLHRLWPDRSTRAGWEGASIFDPEANIAVAAWLLEVGGPSHWECKARR